MMREEKNKRKLSKSIHEPGGKLFWCLFRTKINRMRIL